MASMVSVSMSRVTRKRVKVQKECEGKSINFGRSNIRNLGWALHMSNQASLIESTTVEGRPLVPVHASFIQCGTRA